MMSGLKRVRGVWTACGAGLLALVILVMPAAAVPGAGDVAELVGGGANLEWRPLVDYRGLVLTVSGPDGATRRVEVGAGESPTLSLFDAAGQQLPDGQYTWELRVTPQVDPGVRRQLGAARRTGDDTAVEALRQSGKLPEGGVQSGTFRVTQGSFTIPEERAEPAPAGPRRATASGVKNVTAADQVIPDDLIVQGSICVGFDCVNNESFGFDTIRLKENNTRIKFDDTSGVGFPSRDWQLTANDSASGGANKFSIEDITGALVPFTITAGASNNSIFVSNGGRVGFRTATPVLDLHISTSNTPGIRLEQTNAGGFTAQTWDIAGNEANFFVRDVTGGSRLPFRIRPGAPTSSIDISASGNVGIGTASPQARLEVRTDGASVASVRYTNTNTNGFAGAEYFEGDGGTGVQQGLFVGLDNANNVARINTVSSYPLVILTNSTERIRFPAPGGNFITATNGAVLNSVGQWVDGSSRELKQEITGLTSERAAETLRQLEPVTFAYRALPQETQVGFIAEDVPELVAQGDRSGLSPLEIVGVLTKVVQDQQQTIAELAARLAELERAGN